MGRSSFDTLVVHTAELEMQASSEGRLLGFGFAAR